MTPLDSLFVYARSFLGVPYVFGGNHRLEGMDCSAFVCEVLRKVDLVGAFEDLSAFAIYEKLRVSGAVFNAPAETPAGGILFFGQSIPKIEHVAIRIDGYSFIESGGGGANCKSFDQAKKLGAMVRERPITFRRDLIVGIMPNYPF